MRKAVSNFSRAVIPLRPSLQSHEHMELRESEVGQYTLLWIFNWSLILYLLSKCTTGRNHIYLLNTLHALLCTAGATFVLYYALDTTQLTALTVGYFIVDMIYMLLSDRHLSLSSQPRSRQMDYLHHVLGIVWGLALHLTERGVCDYGEMGNAYVWVQTNEFSTPFYNIFRMTKSRVWGGLFALSFFLSRIVFNAFVVIPMVLEYCHLGATLTTVPYFVLQFVWMGMIVRKMLGHSTEKGHK